jgi:hypothetical protein
MKLCDSKRQCKTLSVHLIMLISVSDSVFDANEKEQVTLVCFIVDIQDEMDG